MDPSLGIPLGLATHSYLIKTLALLKTQRRSRAVCTRSSREYGLATKGPR
jgi:hypothetical protein